MKSKQLNHRRMKSELPADPVLSKISIVDVHTSLELCIVNESIGRGTAHETSVRGQCNAREQHVPTPFAGRIKQAPTMEDEDVRFSISKPGFDSR